MSHIKFVYGKKSLQYSFYKITREKILKEQNHKCFYCKIPLSMENATMDHIIPIKKTKYHSDKNVVVCCETCNKTKGHEELFDIKEKISDPRIIKMDEKIRLRTLKAVWRLDFNSPLNESFRKWYKRMKKNNKI